MRLLIIILLFSFQANATTYYVSNTGSDAANGLTTGTAWQTISKVNGFTFASGDVILFKSGDSWRERLNVPLANLSFGSYGTGAKPLITGFQTVTGFTNVGNIWSASVPSSVAYLNTVLIDGIIRAKGRYPNTGYLPFSSYSGAPINQITTDLTGTPDFTGGEAAVRITNWIIDVANITSQSGGVLNLSPSLTYSITLGAQGFFIQNHESTLDIPGEWYFDSTNKIIKVYSTTSPNVQISTIDTLVNIFEKDNLTFDGLQVTGANKAAFQIDTSNHITIINTSINNCGTLGVSGVKSNSVSLINDSIQNILSGGVYLRITDPVVLNGSICDSVLIDTCYFKNIGHLAGMGLGNNGRYIGTYTVGHNGRITNNRLDSIGYSGIYFNGQNTIVEKNYITNYCTEKNDGAAIYTFGLSPDYFPSNFDSGSIVRNNITIGGGSNPLYESNTNGIYADNGTNGITIQNNTVSEAFIAGINLNDAYNINISGNNIMNYIGSGLRLRGSDGAIGTASIIKDNGIYIGGVTYYTLLRTLGASLGVTDSNYYSRPDEENDLIFHNEIAYSLPDWKAATIWDDHSQGTPAGITTDDPILVYNPTHSDSTVSLIGTYIDIRGVSFNSTIVLHPFTSNILFKSSAIDPTSRVWQYLKGQSL